jgi:microcin C transport system substrate-binding protein
VYERAFDYWGQATNVNIGRNNFDELRFEYFRDGTAALEAFKADAIDWRIENSAKDWATASISRQLPTSASSSKNSPSTMLE